MQLLLAVAVELDTSTVELAVDPRYTNQLSELLAHAEAHYSEAHAAMGAFLWGQQNLNL